MAKKYEEGAETIEKVSHFEAINKWSAAPGIFDRDGLATLTLTLTLTLGYVTELVLVEALKNTSAQVERSGDECTTPICNLFDGNRLRPILIYASAQT